MINAYLEGKDLYAVIAQKMFNNKYEDNLEFYPEGTVLELDGKKIVCGNKTHLNKKGKERRSNAKIMLLGILYGMSAKSTGEGMGKTAKEGQELIDNFYRGFPAVKTWIEQTKMNVKTSGYVEDWYGRRRHLPDIKLASYTAELTSDNADTVFNPFLNCSNRVKSNSVIDKYLKECESIRYNKEFEELKAKALKEGVILTANTNKIAQAERQCVNARVQGGAATLTKLAMLNIYNDKILNDLGFRLLVTIHDEVFGECPEVNKDLVRDRLVQVMVNTAKPYINVPMKCDPYCVTHWYEDEMASLIQEEFKSLEKKYGDGEDALKEVYNNHSEVSKEFIDKALAA